MTVMQAPSGIDDLYLQPYVSGRTPPLEVIEAFESGVATHTRRVEIYEADATTLWDTITLDGVDTGESNIRLLNGNVSVDYNSDERRKLDLTLADIDKKLRPNPNGGLWYDKVLKVYRGVQYHALDVKYYSVIVESETGDHGISQFRKALAEVGIQDINVKLGQIDFDTLSRFQCIIALNSTDNLDNSVMMRRLYEKGRHIITIGAGGTTGLYPHYTSQISNTSWGMTPPTYDTPTSGSYTATTLAGTPTAWAPTGVAARSVPLALWIGSGATPIITAALARHPSGGMWLDIHLPEIDEQVLNLIKAGASFMYRGSPNRFWEIQLGEFYIDNIQQPNYPDELKITARDATKKLINDKLPRTSTFVAGTSFKSLVVGQAALAGIPVSKMLVSIGSELLSSDMTFERGTSRWDIIKSATSSLNYECFFDNIGNFVVRKFRDPSYDAPTWRFGVGPGGNLVGWDRSTNDSRIYNHVIVTAEASDDESESVVGYFGEAYITDPNSPVRKERLGSRVLPIEASWISSNEEARELARDRLKIAALETYEIGWSSTYYPWLEVGEVIEFLDPDILDFEPTKFFMDTISYQLDLGPMSATGKRVTFVGSSGGTDPGDLEDAGSGEGGLGGGI